MSDPSSATAKDELPDALVPPCSWDAPPTTIDLWAGDVVFESDGSRVDGTGRVVVNLSPRPRTCVFVSLPAPTSFREILDAKHLGPAMLHCQSPLGSLAIDVVRQSAGELEASIRDCVFATSERFSFADYVILNGPQLLGKGIRRANAAFAGRHTATVDGVSIVVDQLDPRSKKPRDPYCPTHVARVTLDTPTEHAQFDTIASIMFRTLSLVKGRWVGLLGPWLYGSNQELLRVSPRVTKTSAAGSSPTWCCDTVPDVFEELFPCVFRAFDGCRNDASLTALHWYVETELCSGGVEGSLVLQQAALESLAWSEIVLRRQLCSTDGFEKLPASDKIRWFTSLFRIPVAIPSHVHEISAFAKENNLPDLAAVLTQVRNALVHGTPSKVERLFNRKSGGQERTMLWYLVGGLLAQGVLAVADFRGRLIRRDTEAEWITSAVERVPWATEGGN